MAFCHLLLTYLIFEKEEELFRLRACIPSMRFRHLYIRMVCAFLTFLQQTFWKAVSAWGSSCFLINLLVSPFLPTRYGKTALLIHDSNMPAFAVNTSVAAPWVGLHSGRRGGWYWRDVRASGTLTWTPNYCFFCSFVLFVCDMCFVFCILPF